MRVATGVDAEQDRGRTPAFLWACSLPATID